MFCHPFATARDILFFPEPAFEAKAFQTSNWLTEDLGNISHFRSDPEIGRSSAFTLVSPDKPVFAEDDLPQVEAPGLESTGSEKKVELPHAVENVRQLIVHLFVQLLFGRHAGLGFDRLTASFLDSILGHLSTDFGSFVIFEQTLLLKQESPNFGPIALEVVVPRHQCQVVVVAHVVPVLQEEHILRFGNNFFQILKLLSSSCQSVSKLTLRVPGQHPVSENVFIGKGLHGCHPQIIQPNRVQQKDARLVFHQFVDEFEKVSVVFVSQVLHDADGHHTVKVSDVRLGLCVVLVALTKKIAVVHQHDVDLVGLEVLLGIVDLVLADGHAGHLHVERFGQIIGQRSVPAADVEHFHAFVQDQSISRPKVFKNSPFSSFSFRPIKFILLTCASSRLEALRQ